MMEWDNIDFKYDLSKISTSSDTANDNKNTRLVYRNLPFTMRTQTLCEMMAMFGNFNTCIVGQNSNGEYKILFGFEYIIACERMGLPVRISCVAPDKFELAEKCLSDKYGVNDFSSIQSTNTFVQSNAQPQRLCNDSKAYRYFFKHFHSTDKDKIQGGRFLDIFCGKGVQAEELKKGKYKKLFSAIDNFELFSVGKRFNLSLQITRYQIQRTYQSMLRAGGDGKPSKKGLYDFVMCDSVINSVDSLQAELDVIRCIFVFTKANGLFAINGRLTEQAVNGTYDSIRHLDADGFECKEMDGHYFFQRYHRSKKHFLDIVNEAIPADSYDLEFFKLDGYFYCIFRKKYDILTNEMCESIKREFDLCHKDTSIGYGDKMLSLFKSIYGE